MTLGVTYNLGTGFAYPYLQTYWHNGCNTFPLFLSYTTWLDNLGKPIREDGHFRKSYDIYYTYADKSYSYNIVR